MDCRHYVPTKKLWLVFFSVNIAFTLKYVARSPFDPALFSALYVVACIAAYGICKWVADKGERIARLALLTILAGALGAIGFLLYKIDPLSVNVDRWSATTYFLDGLSNRIYPYGIHTHVCDSNYPSPFPLWHYINIPFWLLGDVGIGLACFLLLLVLTVYKYFGSYKPTLVFFFLLLVSPAYWWEAMVRSDGLSNAILVFCCILWMEKCKISFANHWIATACICGLLASTRFSAIIPLAIYVARPYFSLPPVKKVAAPLIVAGIVLAFFLPYIFWDTESWVFFSRNPFMSQTSTGNVWVLLAMVAVALYLAIGYDKNITRFMQSTAVFVFGFFLVSIVSNHFTNHSDIAMFDDADFDISYLTLSLPYCLFSLAQPNKT